MSHPSSARPAFRAAKIGLAATAIISANVPRARGDELDGMKIKRDPAISDQIVIENMDPTNTKGVRAGLLYNGKAYLDFLHGETADSCSQQSGITAETTTTRFISAKPLNPSLMDRLQTALSADAKTGQVSKETIDATRELAGQTNNCRGADALMSQTLPPSLAYSQRVQYRKPSLG